MKYILIIVGLTVLYGCTDIKSPTSKELPVYKNQIVTIDKSLLVDCDIEPPPDIESYMQSSVIEREALLTKILLKNYKNLGDCNIRLKNARTQQEKIKNMQTQLLK